MPEPATFDSPTARFYRPKKPSLLEVDDSQMKNKIQQKSTVEIWLKLKRPFRYNDVIVLSGGNEFETNSPICRSEFMGKNTAY